MDEPDAPDSMASAGARSARMTWRSRSGSTVTWWGVPSHKPDILRVNQRTLVIVGGYCPVRGSNRPRWSRVSVRRGHRLAGLSLDAERPSRRGRLRGGTGCPFQADDLFAARSRSSSRSSTWRLARAMRSSSRTGIEPAVGLSQGPAGYASPQPFLHAKAQHFQLFQVAERRPAEKVAVQFQPPGLFAESSPRRPYRRGPGRRAQP